MRNSVTASTSLLQQFTTWGDAKRTRFLTGSTDTSPSLLNRNSNQGVIFVGECKRHVRAFFIQSIYEAISLVQCIATLAIAPFATLAELYRLCNGSINALTCLKNICVTPKYLLLNPTFFIARVLNKTVSASAIGVGTLTWHSGEWLVRWRQNASDTVLSNYPNIRDIVYRSTGLTLLAAGAMFVPLAPIQMMALPIIAGSIYGTINNQFTVRECPEYYTMGHYYDGTELEGHAIQTNNLIIKPIVTGCYATTTVTKIAGVILATVGTLPYAKATLPLSYAATMIVGSLGISLVAAHLFSNMKKQSIQKNLDEYATLVNIQWTDDLRNRTWEDLAEIRNQAIKKKRQTFDGAALEKFNIRLQELSTNITSNILITNIPIKYIVGWQANNTRNSIGYVFAGGGTLVLAISTVFLRIFVL